MTETLSVTNTGNVPMLCGHKILHPGRPVRVDINFYSQFSGHKFMKWDWTDAERYMMLYDETGRLTIDWHSPLSMVDGYGRHAIWLIRGLVDLGINVQVHDVDWVDPVYMPSDIDDLRRSNASKPPAKIGIAYTLGYDPHLYEQNSLIKIGITMFETDRLPDRHVKNVNQLDHVIVPNEFNYDVFRRSGVKIPMSVFPAGVDTGFFTECGRPMDGTFKVLMVGALTSRKNPEAAIRIFQKASRGNPDWRLTIKTRKVSHFSAVEREASKDSRISIVVKDDPPDAILKYYHTHDCLLWPSKGEGIGLPPLEAMSTGMEVVCSDNTGMSDFVSSSHCWPIKMAGKESAVGPGLFSERYVREFGDVGNWWVPSENHAIHQLERCFNAWRAGNGKGKRAAKYVREHFTLRHAAKGVVDVLERYV